MSENRELPALENDIKQLLTELEQLKTAQRVGGDSWIVYKNVATNNRWDVNNAVLGAGVKKKYRITFTPADGGRPIANLRLYFDFAAGSGFVNLLPISGTDNEWWVLIEAGGAGVTYSFKFICQSAQIGTLSFV